MNYKIKDTYYSEYMFAYAAEQCISPTSVKVYIPDIMIDKTIGDPVDSVLYPVEDIFINDTTCKPNISGTCVISNYINLNVVANALNGLLIAKGDRLLCVFVNNNPKNGLIIGKG